MIVDLRSDTVTRPTPDMRRAMAEADVGDDVFGEDPTVNRLQERIAELLGCEAALFVPSGTMANHVSIAAHTHPGDEVICEKDAHIFYYEAGAPASLSGVQIFPLAGTAGILDPVQIEEAIRPDNVHHPRTALIEIENTHNRAGGAVYPIETLRAIRQVASRHGIAMHMDGARLWNASTASGVPMKEYAACFDSVSVCFSKGLGAPVGSAVAGSRPFIDKAKRIRKRFGGGMRQAGVLGAAALYAMEHHVGRLAEDHRNARRLAEGLAHIPGLTADPSTVQTNIVFVDCPAGGEALSAFIGRLQREGVLVMATGPTRLRAVTHLDVTEEGIEIAIAVFRQAAGTL
jgi:threonine aldolase